jgi:hypothetical protein
MFGSACEGDYRAVMIAVKSPVENGHVRNGGDGISDRLNDGQVAAF